MAASFHTRSNSLPSTSHPLTSEVDQHLSRLSSSQSHSTSSINGLQDLHDAVDKMLQLPLVQQALSQGHQTKLVDELINGSLRNLDICNFSQNALLQTKESLQELQSVLRRRRGHETELASEIKKYLASRKAVKKAIHKFLGNLKGVENKSSTQINEEHVSMLKEVEAVTFSAFESILSLMSEPKTPSKLSGFSLVSKLISPKRIACKEDRTELNEFEKVDAALSTHKVIKSEKIFGLQDQLKELECFIQDLEEELESLSRRLIKARVSLLNILNN
ncbi:hypothetical protein OWV82_001859 [Melia azedarach]|uniref:Uncharacterized protein n=1 Tax=Melia azedarach TaxID=155640 RepID=A0ACC1YZ01_MELAZ|nr:hypothetical protein OWV82_001859 [Melia azedarach]